MTVSGTPSQENIPHWEFVPTVASAMQLYSTGGINQRFNECKAFNQNQRSIIMRYRGMHMGSRSVSEFKVSASGVCSTHFYGD